MKKVLMVTVATLGMLQASDGAAPAASAGGVEVKKGVTKSYASFNIFGGAFMRINWALQDADSLYSGKISTFRESYFLPNIIETENIPIIILNLREGINLEELLGMALIVKDEVVSVEDMEKARGLAQEGNQPFDLQGLNLRTYNVVFLKDLLTLVNTNGIYKLKLGLPL